MSSFVVNFTLNSVFIPISILCLVKISWHPTRISSHVFFISVSSLSVQSNRLRVLVFDFVLSFGFKFSFSFNLCISLRIRVSIFSGTSIFAGFSGIGKENVLFVVQFIRFKQVFSVSSRTRITCWEHTEDCRVYWFDDLGLPRSHHRKLGFSVIFGSCEVIWLDWLVSMLLSCQLLLKLRRKSAYMQLQWLFPMWSQYLLFYILMDGKQKLWLFWLSGAAWSSYHPWGRVGVLHLFCS